MSLTIASINSGSNGNCYYIGNGEDAVFIDAGISCREIEKRMARLGLDIQKIKAVFVSHEHADHIRGIPVLSKKYGLPVYISPATLQNSRMDLQDVISFAANETIKIGELEIFTFSKFHDAADPYSFNVHSGGITIGIFTDIGTVCNNLITHFKQCHAVFLEANYDDELLENGNYPFHLKKRIKSGWGHLSNAEALDLFKEHKAEYLQLVLLSHLSKDNNNPELVKGLFERCSANTEIAIASRYSESMVYEIKLSENAELFCNKMIKKQGQQLSLF